MKPAEGYIYIIDGTVKCADREEPNEREINLFFHGHRRFTESSFYYYKRTYKSWLESCKDVVNIKYYSDTSEYEMDYGNGIVVLGFSREIKGQRVLYVPEGDKVRVTKIL